ncbi:MAG: phospho-sugar mutase [Odoribacteraceae bacterium]|jgi:phosphoglucomutase|nr:phospho-sugar mutase [Odoribacteraceae bacterium]
MTDPQLIDTARAKAEKWLHPAYDADTRAAVQQLLQEDDPAKLVEAFHADLEFGTGGLRGIMGVGTNRMNIYTVGAATQGFANYINRYFSDEPRAVCIGHDCRHNSRHFAETVADIFSANGIDVYLFESLRPTPEISFAIRELGCKGGVIITASHNPKEYNGYKAYWNDGSQLVPPHDHAVIGEVKQIGVTEILFDRDPARVHALGADFDRVYLKRVQQLSLSLDAIRDAGDLKIVFTPLHGTTYQLVPESLRLWGFTGVHVVPEQSVPDGDFPTVALANPEDPAAFKMATDLAREIDAELIMACDPDGDRIGISVKDDNGQWTLLNGNQAFLVYLEYIILRRKALGMLSGGEYTIKTIVTAELIRDVAEKNGILCHDVYTGFKWIADMIRRRDPEKYIGGGEESFGFMPGAFTRDKDGVASASLMAEIAAWCKSQNSSIYAFLKNIYLKYGFSSERTVSLSREGVSGAAEIHAMMEHFRCHVPRQINGSDIILKKDYLTRVSMKPPKGKPNPLYFDTTSNVLQFLLDDGSKISIRPSGTEPKIKFYYETRITMRTLKEFDKVQELADKRIEGMINGVETW